MYQTLLAAARTLAPLVSFGDLSSKGCLQDWLNERLAPFGASIDISRYELGFCHLELAHDISFMMTTSVSTL